MRSVVIIKKPLYIYIYIYLYIGGPCNRIAPGVPSNLTQNSNILIYVQRMKYMSRLSAPFKKSIQKFSFPQKHFLNTLLKDSNFQKDSRNFLTLLMVSGIIVE